MTENNTLLLRVRKELKKDSLLCAGLDNIHLAADDGLVILSGTVSHDFLRTRVKKIVSAIPGVTTLVDKMTLAPTNANRVGVRIDWANGNMALV